MAKTYRDDDIQSLNPREFTRLRPGVYCGSTEYSTQLLIEIVSNAIDEWSAGHGNVINVDYKDDGCCRVEDFAQGFPINVKREDGETVLQASFDVLNTSGKFSSDGVYEGTALGLNGIGSKLTNFLSHWLTVQSVKDGEYELIHFKEGIFDSRKIGKTESHTGTIVEWQPSEEFFNHVSIDVNRIKQLFKVLACLCPGLTINLSHNGKETIAFNSKRGLNDLVDDIVKDTEIINNRLKLDYDGGRNKINLVMTYTSNYSTNMISYVNTGETDSGPHITQIKSILTREFNKFFKEKKWLKEGQDNLDGASIQTGMMIAFNITAPGVSYDAQTKSRIVKLDMTPFTAEITEAVQRWLKNNEKDIKVLFDKAMSEKKAAEAAKKARDAARDNDKKKKEKLVVRDTKLADCSSSNRMECEIFLTEGDSASGNLKIARNKKTQAIMPLRGKVLNVSKATLEKIKGNAEIVNIIDSLGLEIDVKTLKLTYNPETLRYDKIILMADADDDGYHIQSLLLTLFWTFCKDLILDGHVYVGVPPLYTITEGKDKISYCKDDKELEEFKKTHMNKKYVVKHLKG